jgi:hypothetical protein
MNTAAWRLPVMAEVRSVPHMRSTRSVDGDPAVVGSRAARAAGTLVRSQQPVRTHQLHDPTPAGADAGEAQPCPELALPFAVRRAARQALADCPHQVLLVRHGAERPGSLARTRLLAMAVDGRPGHPPEPRCPLQTMDLGDGGRPGG